MSAPVVAAFTTREAELVALALDGHATRSLGSPLTRADCDRLAGKLRHLVDDATSFELAARLAVEVAS